jgi:peroxidase
MMALSGAHTIGRARCSTFRGRVVNGGEDPVGSIDAGFAAQLRGRAAVGTTAPSRRWTR